MTDILLEQSVASPAQQAGLRTVSEKLDDIIIMPSEKLQKKNGQSIELGSYQYWPVLVPRGIRLYTYEQVPGFLKENPYITDGYRAYLTSRLCIKSLFILSNETVNIWIHLLGFCLFFTLGVYDLLAVLPTLGASREDYVIYSIGLFCFQMCMLCSAGYHLFCCHRSEKTSRRWMALDYAGISIGIIGCYVPGVFYAFYCNNVRVASVTEGAEQALLCVGCNAAEICSSPKQMAAFVDPLRHSCSPPYDIHTWYWRQVYLVTVLAMMLAVFFVQIHPHYLTKKWQQLRSVIFCAVAGYGLIPTVHWIWLSGGFSADIVQEFVFRVLIMYILAVAAIVFYTSKVPERYFPGQLNYLGSSHQIWHILVVLMFYWWHQSAHSLTNHRHSHPCPDYPRPS
ncbi:Progestin and adipoQ receptor family member 3 [Triplophysa tibetana]|uniref:Progestin and adipoQ receptor family member 3 n=1 Tax=Triplophysa tibetana TaxID=1572043 RepID=A0A5A9P5V1_9TELE|nr:Progestin and adipoQ receptor family member 3 [Triplophysa tibetana]